MNIPKNGTPNSLPEAIQNALEQIKPIENKGDANEQLVSSVIIQKHVRDFLAQLLNKEMISTESDETISALKNVMQAIDKKIWNESKAA